MATVNLDLVFLASAFDGFKSYLEGLFEGGLGGNLVELAPYLGELLDTIAIGDGSVITAPVLLLAAGVTIFLGVAGESFFKKTGVPDVAFLLMLGVIFGPVLGVIQPEVVVEIVPYFAAIALIIIMFDGGLNLNLKQLARVGHFAIALALIGFIISVAIVATLAHYFFGWGWLDSILLGSIVGGSSSAIVFGMVRSIRISEGAKNMLAFESAITDMLSTIIAFMMFEAILASALSVSVLGITIGSNVAVGLGLGLGVGIPWMFVTTKLGNAQHAYMLTLGILFVLYFAATYLGESGALTALVFGMMLGNKDRFARVFKFKIRMIDRDDSMHNQLTFLVRVFFFVFVGLLASFGDVGLMIFGVMAAVAIYLGRIIVAKVSLAGRFSKLDSKITSVMIPRGLAAAVLASLSLTLGIPNGETYPQIIFFVILVTVIITTVGISRARKISPPDDTSGGFVQPPESNGGRSDA